jgi:hypothetical protein
VLFNRTSGESSLLKKNAKGFIFFLKNNARLLCKGGLLYIDTWLFQIKGRRLFKSVTKIGNVKVKDRPFFSFWASITLVPCRWYLTTNVRTDVVCLAHRLIFTEIYTMHGRYIQVYIPGSNLHFKVLRNVIQNSFKNQTDIHSCNIKTLRNC